MNPEPERVRVRVAISDADEGEDSIRAGFHPRSVRFWPTSGEYDFLYEVDGFPEFTLRHIRHHARVQATFEPRDDVVIGVRRGGEYLLRADRSEYRADGLPFAYPLGVDLDVRSTDMDLNFVHLDLRLVSEAVASLGAVGSLRAGTRVLGTTTAGRARYLASVIRHVHLDVLESGHPVTELVRANAGRSLAIAYLAAFAESLALGAERTGAGSPALARAIAFIDEHARDPIGVAAIGEAARLGPRGLQLAFRRDLGVTPTEYLTRVRLSRARAELQREDPGTATVAAIAARWGFANAGRFAGRYRDAYGESPRDTLRR